MDLLKVFVVVYSLCSPALTNIRHTTGFHITQLTGSVFMDHLLWEVRVDSSRECAVVCASDDRCVTFVLTEQPERACRGHSQGVDVLISGNLNTGSGPARVYQFPDRLALCSTASTTVTPEASTETGTYSSEGWTVPVQETSVTYSSVETTTTDSENDDTTIIAELTTVLQDTTQSYWLHSSCTDNADCLQYTDDAECFDLICVCSPGYYYSKSTATCVADCVEDDLEPMYTVYAGRHISIYTVGDIGRQYDVTLETCMASCNNENRCRSFDFGNVTAPLPGPFTNGCILRDKVARQVSSLQWVSPTKWTQFDHYQKHCN